jgi:hypothetical protein
MCRPEAAACSCKCSSSNRWVCLACLSTCLMLAVVGHSSAIGQPGAVAVKHLAFCHCGDLINVLVGVSADATPLGETWGRLV